MSEFNGYGLVIKTDSYAGNFERELCAHVTGRIGECEVGDEMVDEHIKSQFGNVVRMPDEDNGCLRPVDIYDDNDGYNSLVIYFGDRPTPEQIEIIKQRAETFNEEYLKKDRYYSEYPESYNPIKILGYKLIQFETTTKEETL